MPSFDYSKYIYPPETLVWFRGVTVPANSVVDLEKIAVKPFGKPMRLLGIYADNQPDIELQVIADNFQQSARLTTGWTPGYSMKFDVPFTTTLVLRLFNRTSTDITLNIAYVIRVEDEEKDIVGKPVFKSTVSGHVSASSNTLVLWQMAGNYILEVTEIYVEKTSGSGTLSLVRDGVETRIDLSELPAKAVIPVSFKVRDEISAYLYPTAPSNISLRLTYNAYKKK